MEKVRNETIVYPNNQEELDHVRKLIRGFVSWHRNRHLEDIALIDEYFDADVFEEELSTLPAKYAMPRGRLLLAFYDDQPAGCIALHELDAQNCEMKRLFVYEQFHGKGIGYLLAKAIIEEARSIGYTSMKLDTSIRQTEALRLYDQLGFRKTGPYYAVSEKLENWLVFMELTL
jgi:putative acetyltransferase